MSSTTPIAVSETALTHRVRLVHAATGRTIRAVRLVPVVWPSGWGARVVDGVVVVTARTDAAASTVPWIDVQVTDAPLAGLLDLSHDDVGTGPPRPPGSVRVALASPEVEVSVPPQPMTLVVHLTRDGATGIEPSTGRTLRAAGSSGPAIDLTEDPAEPGAYRSPALVWGPALTPAALRIGTATVRTFAMDFTRADTRIDLIDPT